MKNQTVFSKLLQCAALSLIIISAASAYADGADESSLHRATAKMLNKVGTDNNGSSCKLVFESDNLGDRYLIEAASEAAFPFDGPNERGQEVIRLSRTTWSIESTSPGSPDEGQRAHGARHTITVSADSVTIAGDGASVTCNFNHEK